MPEIKNMGILTNTPNIYDAVDYRVPDDTSLIYNDKYQGGEAVSCSKPNTIIFDTGIIEAGTFAGTYAVGFFYDSTTATVQGTPLMRFEIYEDGVLMHEDTSSYSEGTVHEYDLNFINYGYLYGLHDMKVFKASSSYQIIVKTSDSLTNDAILDYITLARHGENGVINGKPVALAAGVRNGGSTKNLSTYGTQMIEEICLGTCSGTITAGQAGEHSYTFNTPFKTIVGAWPTIKDGGGMLVSNWSGVDYTNSLIKIYIKNVTGSTWTSSVSPNIYVLIKGYI